MYWFVVAMQVIVPVVNQLHFKFALRLRARRRCFQCGHH